MLFFIGDLLGEYGIGRVNKGVLKVTDAIDFVIGEATEVKKYSDLPVKRLNGKFEAYDQSGKLNIYHFPANSISKRYVEGIAIATIHDLNPIVVDTGYSEDELERYKDNIQYTAKRADYIITVSEASKRDIMEKLHVPESKITVIYNFVSENFYQEIPTQKDFFRQKYDFCKNKKIVMALAGRYHYKNLECAIRGLEKCNSKDAILIVCGDCGEKLQEYHEKLIQELGIKDRVFFTGVVNDAELRMWYNVADVFVFPSMQEGFGIPPLEAMACGTPVIASNASCIPEIVGDAAILVNPLSSCEMAKALDVVLKRDEVKQKYVALGFQRVKLFTEEIFINHMRKYYEKVKHEVEQKKVCPDYKDLLSWYDRDINKLATMEFIDSRILDIYEGNHDIQGWLNRHGKDKVAIYGFGKVGIHFYKMLNSQKVNTLYAIDRRLRGEHQGLNVWNLKEASMQEKPDIIIVTTIEGYKDICEELNKYFKETEIIYIYDFLIGILEK